MGVLGTAAVTAEQLATVTSDITAQVGVILPVALGLFGLFFGIKLVPKLIKRFAK